MRADSRRRFWTPASIALVTAILGLTAGCGRVPSVFRSEAQGADEIRTLAIIVLAICGAVFLFVEILLFLSVLRFRNRREEEAAQTYGNARLEIVWTAVPALILAVMFFLTVRTMSSVVALPGGDLTVRVVAHQWWWEFQYPQLKIVTANELHVPTGKGIKVELQSADVIHSFWVPQLAGKTDLIPGRINETAFFDIKPGTYLGACAEFCGVQHAHMRFKVIAEPMDRFLAWAKDQQAPASEPTSELARAGKQAFLTSPCIACHTVRGTYAAGKAGPDLTHFAGRSTIAAGTLANTRENLSRWIANPQAIKPGNLMPNLALTPQQVQQIVAYLEALK